MPCRTCAVLCRPLLTPGISWILLAPEQSNKTADIVGVSLVCASMGCPHVVLVADKRDNVNNVRDKMHQMLQQLPGQLDVHFCSGKQEDWDVLSSRTDLVAAFCAGTCSLLLPAYESSMRKLIKFLRWVVV